MQILNTHRKKNNRLILSSILILFYYGNIVYADTNCSFSDILNKINSINTSSEIKACLTNELSPSDQLLFVTMSGCPNEINQYSDRDCTLKEEKQNQECIAAYQNAYVNKVYLACKHLKNINDSKSTFNFPSDNSSNSNNPINSENSNNNPNNNISNNGTDTQNNISNDPLVINNGNSNSNVSNSPLANINY